ncbi:MAG TPA: FUSC family protein [Steroidobacteraceae bacterium]|nr:FUSC family protein [Steroidobacteraceae bacterium]
MSRIVQQAHSKELPFRERFAGGAAQGLMSAAAALIAYLPAKPLGLHEGFWASITAIAVVQAQLGATQTSARDQFAGAAVGGLVSAVIVAVAGEHLAAYLTAVVLAMWTCWLLNVSTAARLAGSTATIVLLVPHTGSAGWMILSRLAEVGWGVAVALGTVWLVNWAESKIRPPARAGSPD